MHRSICAWTITGSSSTHSLQHRGIFLAAIHLAHCLRTSECRAVKQHYCSSTTASKCASALSSLFPASKGSLLPAHLEAECRVQRSRQEARIEGTSIVILSTMHAPSEPHPSGDERASTVSSTSHLEELSKQEKQDNKLRNEAELDRETRWDELQAQVRGTLSFLDSERCV